MHAGVVVLWWLGVVRAGTVLLKRECGCNKRGSQDAVVPFGGLVWVSCRVGVWYNACVYAVGALPTTLHSAPRVVVAVVLSRNYHGGMWSVACPCPVRRRIGGGGGTLVGAVWLCVRARRSAGRCLDHRGLLPHHAVVLHTQTQRQEENVDTREVRRALAARGKRPTSSTRFDTTETVARAVVSPQCIISRAFGALSRATTTGAQNNNNTHAFGQHHTSATNVSEEERTHRKTRLASSKGNTYSIDWKLC